MRGLRLLTIVGALALVTALGFSTSWGAGGQAWVKLFQANFTGVPDGPGDGKSFPAERGSIATFTQSGEPFPVVAPASGVFAEQLVLNDRGGRTKVPFGVRCKLSATSSRAVRTTFDIDLPGGATDFSSGIVDTTGVDIATLALDESGQFTLNGMPGSAYGLLPSFLRVDVLLVPAGGVGLDLYVVSVTDRKTNVVLDTWSGKIPGGYRPVDLVRLQQGSSPGLVVLDNITVQEMK